MAPKRRRRKPTRASQHRKVLRDHRHEYDELLAFQGGVCGLCGRPPSDTRRLDMDHDHKSMEVRGLLCVRCNRSLVDWLSSDWLRGAASYLDMPPYRRLLAERSAKENIA